MLHKSLPLNQNALSSSNLLLLALDYTLNAVVELLPHRHCVRADCAVTSPGGAFQTYSNKCTLPIRIWPITDAVLSCSLADSDVVDQGAD